MRCNEENLHANVVIHVVHVSLVSLPHAHQWRQQIADLAVHICRDDMGCVHNRSWVEEPESIQVLMGHKANMVEPMSLKATRGSCIPLIP